MLDQPTRDRLAESLRQLISGAMTNLALNDFLLEQAEGSEDRGVREIAMQTWLLCEEEQVYPIEITESQRCDIARWILFLHSGHEMEWPSEPSRFVTWPVRFLDCITGRRFKLYDKYFPQAHGDYCYWPFFRKEDYDKAVESQKSMRGVVLPASPVNHRPADAPLPTGQQLGSEH